MCTLVIAASGAAGRAQTTAPTTAPAAQTQPVREPTGLDALLTSKRLTGDWGGARTALEDIGIRFDLYYNHNYFANARGGKDTNNAQRNAGSVDLFAYLDFGKMKLIPGGELLVQAKGHFSRSINPKVGALSDPVDDADDDKVIYIDQLWYLQSFLNKKIQLQLGYLDYQTIIDRNAYANSEDKQFSATFLDNNNATVNLPIGLGSALILNPTDWLSFVVAGADGDARLFRTGLDTAFHDGADFFGFFETDLKLKFKSARGELPGTYRFGMLYDPRTRQVNTDSRGGKVPPDFESSDVGFYLSCDQLVFRESKNSTQGLGVFCRYGYRHGDVNRVGNFWSVGAQYQGLLPQRDDDVLGFGVYSALASDRYRREINQAFVGEIGYELYYSVQVTPWFTLTPDFQYIDRPGGLRNARDAVVVGIRARVTF